MRDSCGTSGTGETPQAIKDDQLNSSRPVTTLILPTSCGHEEAHRTPRGKRAPGAEINTLLSNSNKVDENSLNKRLLFFEGL